MNEYSKKTQKNIQEMTQGNVKTTRDVDFFLEHNMDEIALDDAPIVAKPPEKEDQADLDLLKMANQGYVLKLNPQELDSR